MDATDWLILACSARVAPRQVLGLGPMALRMKGPVRLHRMMCWHPLSSRPLRHPSPTKHRNSCQAMPRAALGGAMLNRRRTDETQYMEKS